MFSSKLRAEATEHRKGRSRLRPSTLAMFGAAVPLAIHADMVSAQEIMDMRVAGLQQQMSMIAQQCESLTGEASAECVRICQSGAAKVASVDNATGTQLFLECNQAYTAAAQAGSAIRNTARPGTAAGTARRPATVPPASGAVPDITAIQERLIELGYLKTAASGQYDGLTRGAIAALEEDHGFEPSGGRPAQLWANLQNARPSGSFDRSTCRSRDALVMCPDRYGNWVLRPDVDPAAVEAYVSPQERAEAERRAAYEAAPEVVIDLLGVTTKQDRIISIRRGGPMDDLEYRVGDVLVGINSEMLPGPYGIRDRIASLGAHKVVGVNADREISEGITRKINAYVVLTEGNVADLNSASLAPLGRFALANRQQDDVFAPIHRDVAAVFRLLHEQDADAIEAGVKNQYPTTSRNSPIGAAAVVLSSFMMGDPDLMGVDLREMGIDGIIAQYALARTATYGMCGDPEYTFEIETTRVTEWRDGFGVVVAVDRHDPTYSYLKVPRQFAKFIASAETTSQDIQIYQGIRKFVAAAGRCDSPILKNVEAGIALH